MSSFSSQSPITFPINYFISTDDTNKKRKTISTKNNAYEMINYIDGFVCDDDLTSGHYKSVVFNPKNHHILCIAPSNSVSSELFCKHFFSREGHNMNDLRMTETIEGTMINLFYDSSIGKWEIATRGSIGGNYWYFRTQYPNPEIGDYNIIPNQKTFREMFIDAFQYGDNGEYRGYADLDDITFLEELPKQYSYSLVMQHPENHIVYDIQRPSLYLVGVYLPINRALDGEYCTYDYDSKTWNEIPQIMTILPDEYEGWQCFYSPHSPIIIPSKYGVEQVTKLVDDIHMDGGVSDKNKLFHWKKEPMGVMVLDTKTGLRMHIENPEYKALKELRGNNPNLQYQYFCLLKAGKIHDFLNHFPMYKKQFYIFYSQYHGFISKVHEAYVSYYILKIREQPIPKKYFIHAAKLHHENYLPSLNKGENENGVKQQKMIITHKVVRSYFDEMEPQSILYYLNYELHSHQ